MKILREKEYKSLLKQIDNLQKNLSKTTEEYMTRNCQRYVLKNENEELKQTNLSLQKIIISQQEEIESLREESYEEQKKPKRIK